MKCLTVIDVDLLKFEKWHLNFAVRGETAASFKFGFQTEHSSEGNQTKNYVAFGTSKNFIGKTFEVKNVYCNQN